MRGLAGSMAMPVTVRILVGQRDWPVPAGVHDADYEFIRGLYYHTLPYVKVCHDLEHQGPWKRERTQGRYCVLPAPRLTCNRHV